MIAVTGANGQLGRLVIDALLRRIPASQVVATVRTQDKGRELASLGVTVREADYDRPETLDKAFASIDKLLLISSSEIGKRAQQHQAVIDAAKRAGVGLVVYTSVLHADRSPLGLAEEHRHTEAALKESRLPHVVLRNGWYYENYTAGIAAALEHGAVLGSAGEGRISGAGRVDYAEAAAAVLTSEADQAGRIYELAGDQAFTLAEYAAEIAKQSGKSVVYNDLPQQAYRDVLVKVGLPAGLAALLADSDIGASKGGLFDDGRQLSRLIGRPTTTLAQSVAKALHA